MSDAAKTDPDSGAEAIEAAASARKNARQVFVLYIAGTTPQSTRAVVNIRKLCETHLKDSYDLEIVDICSSPAMAAAEQIIAAPTLVRKSPPPLRRFIGDMADTGRMLAGLGLLGNPYDDPSAEA